jgi:hypothetical protein
MANTICSICMQYIVSGSRQPFLRRSSACASSISTNTISLNLRSHHTLSSWNSWTILRSSCTSTHGLCSEPNTVRIFDPSSCIASSVSYCKRSHPQRREMPSRLTSKVMHAEERGDWRGGDGRLGLQKHACPCLNML